jgi:hypothetical protein
MLETAQSVMLSLQALEEEHDGWQEALAAQEALERYWDPEDPEQADDYLEERETVRLYLDQSEWAHSGTVSEDADPVLMWLEGVLDIVTVWHSRGSREPERHGWELLLGYGGPSIGLELEIDGRATVWAAHWSPTERVHGRLDWLADYLERLGL